MIDDYMRSENKSSKSYKLNYYEPIKVPPSKNKESNNVETTIVVLESKTSNERKELNIIERLNEKELIRKM
jgi:hypothetical protein